MSEKLEEKNSENNINHIDKLKKYLLDEDKGYLTQKLSKGKIMMLSGRWGSGKTYFWQEKIVKNNDKNIYISLYGKRTIRDIENEVLVKAYYRSLGRKGEEKDLIEKFSSTFQIASKTIDTFFGTKIDDVKEEIDELNNNHKNKKAEKFIDDGLIICFDDFERKSSSVDLQDLFGFITNLSIQYKARVVVILNSDVFDSDEKAIFTNLKEKSVSKYMKFSPTCDELFEIIFDFDENIREELKEYRDKLKATFNRVNITNARIMRQTLDNVLEWHEKHSDMEHRTLNLLVLVNINFILNHQVYFIKKITRDLNEHKHIANILSSEKEKVLPNYQDSGLCTIKDIDEVPLDIEKSIPKDIYNERVPDQLKHNIDIGKVRLSNPNQIQVYLDYIDDNVLTIRSLYFMKCYEIDNYCTDKLEEDIDTFNMVNNFIESGML